MILSEEIFGEGIENDYRIVHCSVVQFEYRENCILYSRENSHYYRKFCMKIEISHFKSEFNHIAIHIGR